MSVGNSINNIIINIMNNIENIKEENILVDNNETFNKFLDLQLLINEERGLRDLCKKLK